MQNLSGINSIHNTIPKPVRKEPYIKTINGWTTLTFDNGSSVKYSETVGTGMIYVDLDLDGQSLTIYTADQFVDYLTKVKERGNSW